jgi:alpha-L-fucosidase 2
MRSIIEFLGATHVPPRILHIIGITTLLCGVSLGKTNTFAGEIDWPAFMGPHNMTFEKLPGSWREAPHFGNAMVGSMLYQSGETIRLQIFRADVQDHRDDAWGWTAYSRPRLMIGYFTLHTVGKLLDCHWWTVLWNAEMLGTISTDKGQIRIHHFVHAEDMAIITKLHPRGDEKGCYWTWHPAPAKTTRGGYPTDQAGVERFAKSYGKHYQDTLKVDKANPEGRLEKHGDVSVWIQELMSGGQYATAWSEQETGGWRTHIASIANSFPTATAAETAVSDVSRFLKRDLDVWGEAHRAWWHDYYSRSYVTIADKSLESLYWQTIYRFGCTTRAGRSLVDTPGLWFQGGQWPYITTDWNIQSAHWSVYAANRLEQGQEVVNRLHDGQGALVKAVRPLEWQKDSAYLALAVAPDMIGARDGDMRYYNLVGNLPWTLHNAWMQYRYSMDDRMLRETIYPLLRRSMNLYLHMVEEGKDGKLHLPPTYSPESGIWQDCAFDLALFKWGCLTLLKASKRLGIEDPLIPRWREVAARLPDFPSGDKGFKQGSDKPLHEHHRHLSHLLMIYPLYLVNIEQEGTGDVLKKSLLQAYDLKGADSLPGMVQTHAGPLATALGEGDLALEGLKRQQADLLPNGLWACGGNPCIESTLSVANNIQEMLLQSWSDPAKDEPGVIRIFPALPAEWKEVEFRDLRAEGAFLVSAKRVGGVTQWIRIKSLAGEPCRVKTDLAAPVRITSERPLTLKQVSTGIYELDLLKGEEVKLDAGTPRLF